MRACGSPEAKFCWLRVCSPQGTAYEKGTAKTFAGLWMSWVLRGFATNIICSSGDLRRKAGCQTSISFLPSLLFLVNPRASMTSSSQAPWVLSLARLVFSRLIPIPPTIRPSQVGFGAGSGDRCITQMSVEVPNVPARRGPSARSAVRTLHAARLARGLPLGRNDPPRLAQMALERVIRDLIEQDADPPAGADRPRVK